MLFWPVEKNLSELDMRLKKKIPLVADCCNTSCWQIIAGGKPLPNCLEWLYMCVPC